MDRKTQLNLGHAVVALMAIFAIQRWWVESQRVETIPYSQFEALVEQGKVKDAYVTDQFIRGTLKEAIPDGRMPFITARVEPQLAEKLAAASEATL